MELWLSQYGVFAIFVLLALGIVGLPIPDETLIVLAGVLVSKGKLELIPTVIAVFAGGFFGITVSYLLGYTGGHYLIDKFGYLLHLTPKKLTQAEKWFKDIGKWILFFGYFIIGLRHLSGLVAGIMKLSYRQFALFAYSGLLLWASSIFTIGYYFSQTWEHKLNLLTFIGIIAGLIALLAIYAYFFYKHRKLN